MEDKGEITPKPDKEGFCYAIGRILGDGYVLISPDIRMIAEKYNVTPTSSPDMLNTHLARKVMTEIGVVPTRKDYKATKIWVDTNGSTDPAEVTAMQKRIDSMKKGSRS